ATLCVGEGRRSDPPGHRDRTDRQRPSPTEKRMKIGYEHSLHTGHLGEAAAIAAAALSVAENCGHWKDGQLEIAGGGKSVQRTIAVGRRLVALRGIVQTAIDCDAVDLRIAEDLHFG